MGEPAGCAKATWWIFLIISMTVLLCSDTWRPAGRRSGERGSRGTRDRSGDLVHVAVGGTEEAPSPASIDGVQRPDGPVAGGLQLGACSRHVVDQEADYRSGVEVEVVRLILPEDLHQRPVGELPDHHVVDAGLQLEPQRVAE